VQVGSLPIAVTAGQTAYIVSVMTVNGATETSLFDNEIVCKLPDGTSKNMVIGQNVYKAGALHPEWEAATLTTRFLVQSPVAGTVNCAANIRVASQSVNLTYVQLVNGSLTVADPSVDNATDGQAIQASVPRGLYKVDQTNPTVRVPAIEKFKVADGFTHLSVFGDTEYQVCHTASTCTKTASKAQFTLVINQWKTTGELCYSQAVTTRTETMSYWVHHYYVPLHSPEFAIRTGNDCAPEFNAYVRVDWLSGDTGAVQGTATPLEDYRGSTTTHASDMSHIYAVPYVHS